MRTGLRPAFLLVPLLFGGCESAKDPEPTWHSETRALVESRCGACHVAGGVAPFRLETYDDVAARPDLIRLAVSERRMPPWLAGPGCSEYEHDRSLTDEQLTRFVGWLDAGMPEGDPADYVAPTPPGGGLSREDLTLTMPVAYTAQSTPDDYRCFMLDWPYADARYVTGFRADPGELSVVHHVVAFLVAPGDVADLQALDDADAGEGWTCFGGPGAGIPQFLGAWAPGGQGSDFPEGTGLRVEPGSTVVLQIHYNLSTSAAVPDQTSIALRIDPTVERRAYLMPFADPTWVTDGTMTIPAGQSDVVHSFSLDPTPYLSYITDGAFVNDTGFDIHSASLHMHTRGTRASFEIKRDGQDDECMLDIPRWDFGWQNAYRFKQPKRFEPGDRLRMECHWDNSDGTAPLNWGEGTGDEMCLGFLYIVQ